VPVSSDQIVSQVTGTTAPDGTTADAVAVVSGPTMNNGVETAQINVTFSDSSNWREVYSDSASDGTGWHVTAEYQNN
jgi:hypothetical protein